MSKQKKDQEVDDQMLSERAAEGQLDTDTSVEEDMQTETAVNGTDDVANGANESRGSRAIRLLGVDEPDTAKSESWLVIIFGGLAGVVDRGWKH